MKLYVGNLAYAVNSDDLNNAFSQYGEVTDANVIIDKMSGKSKGFGFVEMPNNAEAEKAIQALNGQDLKGRALKVNEAQPRDASKRPPQQRRAPRY